MREPINARPFEVSLEFTVKTYDIDSAGHCSNLVYIRWMEDLRLEMLQKYVPLDVQMAKGVAPILTKTHIEYRRSLKLLQKPIGRMWLHNMGSVKVVMRAEFTLDGIVVADGEQSGCFITLATGRPVRVPEEFRGEKSTASDAVQKVGRVIYV